MAGSQRVNWITVYNMPYCGCIQQTIDHRSKCCMLDLIWGPDKCGVLISNVHMGSAYHNIMKGSIYSTLISYHKIPT